MHKILPWLYIGKYTDTINRPSLERTGIEAMLSMAEPVEYPGIETLYLAVDDGVEIPLNLLQQGVDFIRRHHTANHTILVACGAGRSRSVSFAVAALKEIEGIGLREALDIIKRRHPDAMPHPKLWQSLCDYYGEDTPFLDIL